MRNKLFITALFALAFASPGLASAASVTPVCADYTLSGTGVSCSAAVVTFPGNVSTQTATFNFTFNSGTTYYYQYTLNKTNGATSATNWWQVKLPTAAQIFDTDATTGAKSGSFTATGNDTQMQFRAFGSGGHQWGGTIASVCVSDSPTGCSGGGGGGGGGGGTSVPGFTLASSTTAIGTAFVNAGTILALLLGILIGGLVALFAVGFFSRKVRQHVTGSRF